jgi:hypothetical protein
MRLFLNLAALCLMTSAASAASSGPDINPDTLEHYMQKLELAGCGNFEIDNVNQNMIQVTGVIAGARTCILALDRKTGNLLASKPVLEPKPSKQQPVAKSTMAAALKDSKLKAACTDPSGECAK